MQTSFLMTVTLDYNLNKRITLVNLCFDQTIKTPTSIYRKLTNYQCMTFNINTWCNYSVNGIQRISDS